MKGLIKVLILVVFSGLSVVSLPEASAQDGGYSSYNTSCLEGGSNSGAFPCNSNSLTQPEAHSYCVSQSRNNTNGDVYLDCMGSFLPFYMDGAGAVNCSLDSQQNLTWSNNQCGGVIPEGDYRNLEKISISNNVEGFSGNAVFICNNGSFKLESGTSSCVKQAEKCEIDSSNPFVWGVTHIGDLAIEDLDLTGSFWEQYGLMDQYNAMISQECISSIEGNFETYSQFLVLPNQGNLRGDYGESAPFNFGQYPIIDGSETVGDFFNNPSYQIGYCYDGNVNNEFARSRFETLLNSGLIEEIQKERLAARKCTTYPMDCQGGSLSEIYGESGVIPSDISGISCDFGVDDMKHGDNPLQPTTNVNVGSPSNPWEEGLAHGYATFSCFNGNIIEVESECYGTSICQNEDFVEVQYGNALILSEEVEIGNQGEDYTQQELIDLFNLEYSDQILDMENYCKDNYGFANSEGYLNKNTLSVNIISENEPPLVWDIVGSDTNANCSDSGTGVHLEHFDSEGGTNEEEQAIIDSYNNGEVYCSNLGQEGYIEIENTAYGECERKHFYYYECIESEAVGGDSFGVVQASARCDFVDEPIEEQTTNLCSIGEPTDWSVIEEQGQEVKFSYSWSCSNGLITDNSCLSNPDGQEVVYPDKECFTDPAGYYSYTYTSNEREFSSCQFVAHKDFITAEEFDSVVATENSPNRYNVIQNHELGFCEWSVYDKVLVTPDVCEDLGSGWFFEDSVNGCVHESGNHSEVVFACPDTVAEGGNPPEEITNEGCEWVPAQNFEVLFVDNNDPNCATYNGNNPLPDVSESSPGQVDFYGVPTRVAGQDGCAITAFEFSCPSDGNNGDPETTPEEPPEDIEDPYGDLREKF